MNSIKISVLFIKEIKLLWEEAHKFNMQVYADMVLNHTNGADEEELNEFDGERRWTKYTPGSKLFNRDWTCYHPSYFERWDDEVFEDFVATRKRNISKILITNKNINFQQTLLPAYFL